MQSVRPDWRPRWSAVLPGPRRSSAIGPWQPEPKADDPCDPWKSLTREKHPKGWTGRMAAAAKLRNAMIIRIYFF